MNLCNWFMEFYAFLFILHFIKHGESWRMLENRLNGESWSSNKNNRGLRVLIPHVQVNILLLIKGTSEKKSSYRLRANSFQLQLNILLI